MDQAITPDSGEPSSVGDLMRLAQAGDREAFREIQRLGEAQGVSYTAGWSAQVLLFRLQDRAGGSNLLARAGVEDDLATVIRDLSDPRDGPIERMIVARAAICAVDAHQADMEYLVMMQQVDDPWDAEVYDRRRDRAQRRLLAVLKSLAYVRRMSRPGVQVNIGINPR